MTNKMNPDNKVEEALNSLEGLQKATASPYLITQLLGKLREDKRWWSVLGGILSKPAVAFSLCLAILMLNLWLVLSQPSVLNDATTDPLNELAVAYHFDQNNSPEQNIPLP